MKKLSIDVFNKAIMLTTILGCLFVGGMSVLANSEMPTAQSHEAVSPQYVAPLDGAYFDTRHVVDNIYYGEGGDYAYYLIYDDVDAGLNYEAVRVTQETYAIVLDCLENSLDAQGTMIAADDCEQVLYEIVFDE